MVWTFLNAHVHAFSSFLISFEAQDIFNMEHNMNEVCLLDKFATLTLNASKGVLLSGMSRRSFCVAVSCPQIAGKFTI